MSDIEAFTELMPKKGEPAPSIELNSNPYNHTFRSGGKNSVMSTMEKEVSDATRNCYRQGELLWVTFNAIPDEVIDKSEWNFILKSLGKNGDILSQFESDFLFLYLDTDYSGDITKQELRTLLDKVIRDNKWNDYTKPSTEEMIKTVHKYALEDSKNQRLWAHDIQLALIRVKNQLTDLIRKMGDASIYYEEIKNAINDPRKEIFDTNPRKIYHEHLEEYEDMLNKLKEKRGSNIQKQYEEVKKIFGEAEKKYKSVSDQISHFAGQDRELEKCCKIFGYFCPCT